jgi:hypothetical protein
MAKTLTTLRKEIDLTDAANIRAMMHMFAEIAKNNPDAVKATFNKYMKSKSNETQNLQVQFYADRAEQFKEMFDLD